MNNALFFLHALLVMGFCYGAFRLGKEALFAFVATSWLLANFFVTKEICLFGLEVTASDTYTIGAMVGLFVIQEYFGREAAKKCIWISFFLLFFTAVNSFLHLSYLPSQFSAVETAFQTLLQPAPRLAIASLVTFFITQQLDLFLFSQLKKIPFVARVLLTGSITQLIDTALFSFLGLSGIVHSLFDVIVMSYLVKLLVVILSTPFLPFFKRADASISI